MVAADLTPEDLEREAEALYVERSLRAAWPAWHQLGDVTKSVWRDMVLAGERAEPW